LPTPARTTRWAGVPPADRALERRALLLDAAFALLGTEGMAGTTVRAVCHSARLNARYFYESFDDLDALVVAVFDRLVGELRAEIEAAVATAGPEPRDQVRATVETTTRWVDEDRRRARVLYVEALGNEALNRRRLETGFAIAGFVEARGRAPKGEHVGQVTAAILVGGFSELLVAWLDGRIPVSRRQLVDDATELFVALGDAAGRIAGARGRSR
jgi:AcrR family transcriptional regulator